ncbi:MAG: hypothetical protein M3335_06590 [Actinomycetota bacterium]|nr:hypothetical protein [Actinomycetota bacterium]
MSRLFVLAVLVLSMTFAACGGGDEAGDRQAEAEERKAEAAVEKAIRKEFEGHDPAACTAMETTAKQDRIHRFLPRALKYCEGGEVEEIYLRSARIEDVRLKGNSATAEVVPSGNKFDGQTVRVSLSQGQSGRWEFDRVLGFKGFDRLAMVRAFRDSLTGISWTTPERVFGNCLVNQFKLESAAEVKKLMMEPAASPFDSAVEVCAARFSAAG